MLHASGEFDDAGYHVASEEIDAGLVRTIAERKDVESITTYLIRLDPTAPINAINHNDPSIGPQDARQQQTQSPTNSSAPDGPATGKQHEQTLVLHVKEN